MEVPHDRARTDWRAIASLCVLLPLAMWEVASLPIPDRIGNILDAAAVRLHPVLALAGIFLGSYSIAAIRQSGGRFKGRFLAVTGITLGSASFLLFVMSVPRRPPHNENAAIANLRTMHTAQTQYRATHGTYGRIPELVAADLLDRRFESGTMSGYLFDITLTATGYKATATRAHRRSGSLNYFSTEDGLVRWPTDPGMAPPGLAGKPIQ
jgi:hypothetical protein